MLSTSARLLGQKQGGERLRAQISDLQPADWPVSAAHSGHCLPATLRPVRGGREGRREAGRRWRKAGAGAGREMQEGER